MQLQRLDPGRNMARFYRLDLGWTLFGEVSLIRTWGRIGSQGRSLEEIHHSYEAAIRRAAQLSQTKVRRGYATVSP